LSENESFKALVAERAAEKVAAPGAKPQPKLRPRDAATLIIIDSEGAAPRVLLGKRRDDLKFMPGKYVFPGGRLDADDKTMAAARELRQSEIDKLLLDMKGHASAARARGLAMTAVRETFEEAGLIIGGVAAASAPEIAPPAENPSLDSPAAKSWRQFQSHGFVPDLAPLTFLARAITPPGRPRRFDTRFFCVEGSAISKTTDHNDGELVRSRLDDAGRGPRTGSAADHPRHPRGSRRSASPKRSLDDPTVPIPYYFNRHGTFRREMLHLGAPTA
jgi:8-oxo-dGTP pyrophosphatase MutT (NUDIX family)